MAPPLFYLVEHRGFCGHTLENLPVFRVYRHGIATASPKACRINTGEYIRLASGSEQAVTIRLVNQKLP